ncbi:hypothetical protein ACR79T_18165 [Sphingobacterium spiritivorum]|uniref:hypothetical protein n=1 Tax=Sphingobacterium spiritivorum TaxID=258 RepID=UPI003DA5AF36
MYTNTPNKKTSIPAVLILCSLLLLSSCSKKDAEKQIPPDQVAQLSFAIEGIDDGSDAAPTKNRAAVAGNNINTESQLFELDNIVAGVSVTTGPIKTQSVSATDNNSKQRAATNMTSGYKYRVVVLDAVNGTYVGSVEATAKTSGTQDEAAKIDVVKGGNYKWYAYSYNDANTVPVLSNEVNPVFTPSYNKDLLIAQGTVTAGTGTGQQDRQIPITFKHALAKVTVRFDASSRTDNISVLNATLASANYFNSGTVSLNTTTGALSYNATGQHNVSAINVSLPNNVATASYYTIPNGAISGFQVNVANLTVGPLNTTNKAINFANDIIPVAGKEVIANINILDVTVVGGVYWATGNLYYDAATKLHKIRDEDVIPRSLRTGGSFLKSDGWNWKATYPYGGVNGNSTFFPYETDGVDPCTKVLPLNTWRMPEITEFQPLVNLKGSSSTYELFIPSTSSETGHQRFRANANSKWVQFNMDGSMLGGFQHTGYYYARTSNRSYFYITPSETNLVTNGFFGSGPAGTYYNIRCVLNR